MVKIKYYWAIKGTNWKDMQNIGEYTIGWLMGLVCPEIPIHGTCHSKTSTIPEKLGCLVTSTDAMLVMKDRHKRKYAVCIKFHLMNL